jgi:hypothetical protein
MSTFSHQFRLLGGSAPLSRSVRADLRALRRFPRPGRPGLRRRVNGSAAREHIAMPNDPFRIDHPLALPASGETLRGTLLMLLREYEKALDLGCQPGDFHPVREDPACGEVAEGSLASLLDAPHFQLRSAARGASCRLVLTASGADFVRCLLGGNGDGIAESVEEKPRWDGHLLQLWWRGDCIREYRHDATNQRIVLDAFAAQGWPRRLDDPLPRERGVNVKTRLRETIKGLNRGQRPRMLLFHGDGTGLGVRWEAIA